MEALKIWVAWNFLRASLTANDVIKNIWWSPFLFRASKVYKPEILQRHQRATLCGPSLYNTRWHFLSREMYTNASSVLNNNSSGRYKSIICLLSLNGIRLSLDSTAANMDWIYKITSALLYLHNLQRCSISILCVCVLDIHNNRPLSTQIGQSILLIVQRQFY